MFKRDKGFFRTKPEEQRIQLNRIRKQCLTKFTNSFSDHSREAVVKTLSTSVLVMTLNSLILKLQ